MLRENTYDIFCTLIETSGTLSDERKFVSKELDGTGLHYFGARYYNCSWGRFLTPDPHSFNPENLNLMDLQSLNPYIYCTNDPLYYVDPSGETPIAAVLIIPAGVGAIGAFLVDFENQYNKSGMSSRLEYYKSGEYSTGRMSLVMGAGAMGGIIAVYLSASSVPFWPAVGIYAISNTGIGVGRDVLLGKNPTAKGVAIKTVASLIAFCIGKGSDIKWIQSLSSEEKKSIIIALLNALGHSDLLEEEMTEFSDILQKIEKELDSGDGDQKEDKSLWERDWEENWSPARDKTRVYGY